MFDLSYVSLHLHVSRRELDEDTGRYRCRPCPCLSASPIYIHFKVKMMTTIHTASVLFRTTDECGLGSLWGRPLLCFLECFGATRAERGCRRGASCSSVAPARGHSTPQREACQTQRRIRCHSFVFWASLCVDTACIAQMHVQHIPPRRDERLALLHVKERSCDKTLAAATWGRFDVKCNVGDGASASTSV